MFLDVKEAVIPTPAKVSLAYSLSHHVSCALLDVLLFHFLYFDYVITCDQWSGAASQRAALQMSVGLLPPDRFWTRISQSVRDMIPSEKIFFLSDIISHFGHSDEEAVLMEELPVLLDRILASLRIRLSNFMEDDIIQQIAADLVISEGARKGFAQNEELLTFLKVSYVFRRIHFYTC